MNSILHIVTLVIMFGGLLSLLTLVIPGLTVIWISALVYALASGFNTTAIIAFALMTALMLFGNFVDQLVMGVRARKSGATWLSIGISMLTAFIFSILFPPFGGLIAAMIVLMAFEFYRLRDWKKAANSSKEMAIGCMSALVLRLLIGMVMIAVWFYWVWQNQAWIFG
jgi:uncharacterized protein